VENCCFRKPRAIKSAPLKPLVKSWILVPLLLFCEQPWKQPRQYLARLLTIGKNSSVVAIAREHSEEQSVYASGAVEFTPHDGRPTLSGASRIEFKPTFSIRSSSTVLQHHRLTWSNSLKLGLGMNPVGLYDVFAFPILTSISLINDYGQVA
jgi:hypothetical protein